MHGCEECGLKGANHILFVALKTCRHSYSRRAIPSPVRCVQILDPKVVDIRQLEREYLRQFLAGHPQEEDRTSHEWDQLSESTLSGVSMGSDERVDGIDCSMGNYSGGLPATLGKMSRLVYLHAGSNQFNGTPVILGYASMFQMVTSDGRIEVVNTWPVEPLVQLEKKSCRFTSIVRIFQPRLF